MPSEQYVRDRIISGYKEDNVSFTPDDVDRVMKSYFENEKNQQSYSAGKTAYEQSGSEAAPNFIDQFMFNMGQHMDSFISGNVGIAGYVAGALGLDPNNVISNYARELQLKGEEETRKQIANDIELQALIEWQADQPIGFDNFWQLDMLSRTLASSLPSIVEMAAIAVTSKGIGSLLTKASGKTMAKVVSEKGRKLALLRIAKSGEEMTKEGFEEAAKKATRDLTLDTIAQRTSMAGMTMLEGSSQYNEAMSYLVDEEGQSVEEAAKAAGPSAMIYGLVSGGFEYMPMAGMLKKAGILNETKREGAKLFAKSTSAVIRKAGHLTQDGLKQAAEEGTTEWLQYMAQVAVQVPYKEGWGDSPEEAFRNFSEAWKREAWSPEARESFFGGLLTGAAITGPTSLLRNTPDRSGGKKELDPEKILKNAYEQLGEDLTPEQQEELLKGTSNTGGDAFTEGMTPDSGMTSDGMSADGEMTAEGEMTPVKRGQQSERGETKAEALARHKREAQEIEDETAEATTTTPPETQAETPTPTPKEEPTVKIVEPSKPIGKMNKAELQEHAQAMGIDDSGYKPELIARINEETAKAKKAQEAPVVVAPEVSTETNTVDVSEQNRVAKNNENIKTVSTNLGESEVSVTVVNEEGTSIDIGVGRVGNDVGYFARTEDGNTTALTKAQLADYVDVKTQESLVAASNTFLMNAHNTTTPKTPAEQFSTTFNKADKAPYVPGQNKGKNQKLTGRRPATGSQPTTNSQVANDSQATDNATADGNQEADDNATPVAGSGSKLAQLKAAKAAREAEQQQQETPIAESDGTVEGAKNVLRSKLNRVRELVSKENKKDNQDAEEEYAEENAITYLMDNIKEEYVHETLTKAGFTSSEANALIDNYDKLLDEESPYGVTDEQLIESDDFSQIIEAEYVRGLPTMFDKAEATAPTQATEPVTKEQFKNRDELVKLAKDEGVKYTGNMDSIVEAINTKREATKATAPTQATKTTQETTGREGKSVIQDFVQGDEFTGVDGNVYVVTSTPNRVSDMLFVDEYRVDEKGNRTKTRGTRLSDVTLAKALGTKATKPTQETKLTAREKLAAERARRESLTPIEKEIEDFTRHGNYFNKKTNRYTDDEAVEFLNEFIEQAKVDNDRISKSDVTLIRLDDGRYRVTGKNMNARVSTSLQNAVLMAAQSDPTVAIRVRKALAERHQDRVVDEQFIQEYREDKGLEQLLAEDIKEDTTPTKEDVDDFFDTPDGNNKTSNDDHVFKESITENETLVKDDQSLSAKMLKRLHEQFPNVKVEIIEELIQANGIEAFGMAVRDMITISEQGTIDTIPHEFAHIWVSMMRDTYAVKLGLKRYRKPGMTQKQAEEALVQKIGEYYTNKMREGTYEKNLMRNWLKKFVQAVKGFLGNVDATGDLLGEMFYNADLKTVESYYDGVAYSKNTEENSDVNNIAVGTGGNDAVVFLSEIGVNFTGEEYAMLVDVIRESPNVTTFINNFRKFGEKGRSLGSNEDGTEIRYEGFKDRIPKSKIENWNKFSDKFENSLKQMFAGKISATEYYTTENNQGILRTMWEVIFDKAGEFQTIQRKQEHPEVKGRLWDKAADKLLALMVSENFLERRRKLNSKLKIETHSISKNDLLEHIFDEKVGEDESKYNFFKKNADGITVALVDELNKQFAKSFQSGAFDKLYTIAATKGGDGSQLTFASVEVPFDKNVTRANYLEFIETQKETYRAYIDAEVEDGTIPVVMADQIYEANLPLLKKNPYALMQVIGVHEWAKETRHRQYLMPGKWKGIEDFFNRLRIDMTEGKTPVGLNKYIENTAVTNTIMIVPEDTIIVMPNGREVEYSKIDGATLTSGGLMNAYAEVFGYKRTGDGHNLAYAKTVINHRDDNGKHELSKPGITDYLGMKHAEFVLPEGLVFKRPDGTVIATTGKAKDGTYFMAGGKRFDRIASPNEAKNTNGRFDAMYEIHELDENDVKLLTTNGNKSTTTSAFPYAAAEMMSTRFQDEHIDALVDAIIENNNLNVVKHSGVLFELLSNPAVMKAEINRTLEDGEIPTELQQVLIKDPTGSMLSHPTNMPLMLDYLANKYIKNNIFKGRRNDGSQTQAYYQPDIFSDEVKDGEVAFGVDNKSALNQAVKHYLLDKDITLREFNAQPLKARVEIINKWITDGGEVYVLASRQPVNRWTTARPFKLAPFRFGAGSNVFHTWADITEIFEGDWDGDKGYYDFFRTEDVESGYLQAYRDAFEGKSVDKKWRDKLLRLELFSRKLDKIGSNNLLINSDMKQVIQNQDVAENAVGIVVTQASLHKSLSYKQVKITVNGRTYTMKEPHEREYDEDGEPIEGTFAPNEVFPIPLDVEYLSNEDIQKYIIAQGDIIVDDLVDGNEVEFTTVEELRKLDNPVYLKTTVEHVYSILTQAATDDAKFGLLSKLPANYIEDLMFAEEFPVDDSETGDKDRKAISGFAMKFLNQIGRRQGKLGGNQLGFSDLVSMAESLNDLYNAEPEHFQQQLDDQMEQFLKTINRLDGDYVAEINSGYYKKTSIEMGNPSLSPIESMIAKFGEEASKLDNGNLKYDPLHWTPRMNTAAHVIAGQALVDVYNTLTEGDRITDAELAEAVLWADGFNSQYMKVIDETGDPDKVKIDKNDRFAKLFEDAGVVWNALTDTQKMIATLHSLTSLDTRNKEGKATNKVDFQKLFPVRFQHNKIYQMYGMIRQQALNNLVKFDGDVTQTIETMVEEHGYELIEPADTMKSQKIYDAYTQLRGWRFKSIQQAIATVEGREAIREALSKRVDEYYNKCKV